jgi:hypothetical protein
MTQASKRPMLSRLCSRTGRSDCPCASADLGAFAKQASMSGSSGNRRTKHEVIKSDRRAGLLGLVTTYSGWPLVGC